MQANVQEPSSHSAFLFHRSQQTGAQAVEVARFTVLNYIKSGWILFDGVLLFFVYMAFLYYPIMEASQFFGVALPAMALDAFVSSAILLHRTFKANLYMQLSHLPSRSASLYGLMLATCVLRVLLYLCFYLLTLLMHMDAGIGMTTQIFWVGSLATVLIAIFCSLLMVTLLQPIARRLTQIVFLAWLAFTLIVNTIVNIPLRSDLQFVQYPLFPIKWCYQFCYQGTIDGQGWLAVLLLLAYMVVLVFLARLWLARRDLLLN